MNPEEMALVKTLEEAMEPKGTVIHWFDILALMIIGYWFGNVINSFLWWI